MLSADVRTRVARAGSQLEKRLRRVLCGSTPSWGRHPNALPWFDQPDALTRCAPHARQETDTALLSKWVRDGYVVVEDAVDPADIDAMLAMLEGLWEAPAAIPGL